MLKTSWMMLISITFIIDISKNCLLDFISHPDEGLVFEFVASYLDIDFSIRKFIIRIVLLTLFHLLIIEIVLMIGTLLMCYPDFISYSDEPA